jgi:hypothetical protein
MNRMLEAGPGRFEGGLTPRKYRALTGTTNITASRSRPQQVEIPLVHRSRIVERDVPAGAQPGFVQHAGGGFRAASRHAERGLPLGGRSWRRQSDNNLPLRTASRPATLATRVPAGTKRWLSRA